MIEDKKIEEAASVYGTSNGYSVVGPDGRMSLKPELENAFEAGAHWAINEFLKNLWHPANKIPKRFNHYGFAALYILQYNHQIRMVLYDKDNMSWKNVISNSEYWLYVDDLLPKQEGGEQ